MIVGVTGLIGTGKSTVCRLLKDYHGAMVHDADYEVHQSYKDQNVRQHVASIFNLDIDFEFEDIIEIIKDDLAQRRKLEAVMHKRVRDAQLEFLKKNANQPLLVLDVPLLFETRAEELCDQVWLTTCSFETQKKRVLSRMGYNEEKLKIVRAWQGDDGWKKEKATQVIDTDKSIETLEQEIAVLVDSLL